MTTAASFPGRTELAHDPSAGADALKASAATAKPGRGRSATQATALVELAAEAELWHAPNGTAYATIEIENRREHWPVRSRALAQWLAGRHFQDHAAAPCAAALSDALAVLALESSPIAVPVRRLLSKGPWRGTATELLVELNRDAAADERRSPDWPKSPCKLANAWRRLAPNLRACNLLIEFTRAGTVGRHRGTFVAWALARVLSAWKG